MPSVEIVCIGQTEVSKFENLPFRLFAENRLVSHRSPRPLFQSDFEALTGCIYHLCNPERGYTAYELLNMSRVDETMQQSPAFRVWVEPDGSISRTSGSLATQFYFRPAYVCAIQVLIEELLKASPPKKLLFTTDYQFGPKVRRYKRPMTLENFWKIHDARKLRMNTLYPLYSTGLDQF